jgi:hypothetical protein
LGLALGSGSLKSAPEKQMVVEMTPAARRHIPASAPSAMRAMAGPHAIIHHPSPIATSSTTSTLCTGARHVIRHIPASAPSAMRAMAGPHV